MNNNEYYLKRYSYNATMKAISVVDFYFQHFKEILISKSWEPLVHFGIQITITNIYNYYN